MRISQPVASSASAASTAGIRPLTPGLVRMSVAKKAQTMKATVRTVATTQAMKAVRLALHQELTLEMTDYPRTQYLSELVADIWIGRQGEEIFH